MGTITRSFANNITTSGVFTSSAFNNASFDSVTSVPTDAITVGAMKFISSSTASSSASIEITLGSYKEYVFFFNNLHPQTDGVQLQCNFSTDNGSNYNVTKTTSYFLTRNNESGPSFELTYKNTLDLAASTSNALLSVDSSNDADHVDSGYMHLFNPSSTTYVKGFISTVNNVQTGNAAMAHYVAGFCDTTSALTNIKFQFSSGNIDDGKILVFGLE